ncbi:MAG: hypothetical protein Unbinned4497contig1000_30 [Prokaryotic dsDNA virus sp.]|nr:MAG: hypothetical protein Unbinned4497contig1000_30 [Prokaryotic dsDNA virus sp.]
MIAKGALDITKKPIPNNLTAWIAFNSLRNSRQISFNGVAPIPFTEIMAYCKHAGIDCEIERSRLARFVMALDKAEREQWHNQHSD